MDHVCKGCWIAIWMLLLTGLAVAGLESGGQKNAIEQLNAMNPAEFKDLVQLACKGDAAAQTLLGIAYMRGVRVAQDDTAALDWFKHASKKRNFIAEDNLALMYFFGRGTKENYAEALKWFQKAGEDGSNDARFNIALMYHHGYGVKQNMEEAAKWYEVAAIQGNAMAQNTIGYLYEQGLGVSKNTEEAEKWYHKAAAQGAAMAEYNLGVLYLRQERHQEAYDWFLLAAKQGHKLAARNLAALNLHGHCMEVNYREAYRWLMVSHQTDDWAVRTMATCKEHLSAKELEQVQASVRVVGTP